MILFYILALKNIYAIVADYIDVVVILAVAIVLVDTKALLALLLAVVYGWSAQREMEHSFK